MLGTCRVRSSTLNSASSIHPPRHLLFVLVHFSPEAKAAEEEEQNLGHVFVASSCSSSFVLCTCFVHYIFSWMDVCYTFCKRRHGGDYFDDVDDGGWKYNDAVPLHRKKNKKKTRAQFNLNCNCTHDEIPFQLYLQCGTWVSMYIIWYRRGRGGRI